MHLWVEAFLTAIYLINRIPLSTLGMKSPYQNLFKKLPDYNGLKVFSCRCYPYLRDYTKNKFDKKTYPCVFIGCSPLHKGYHCLQPQTKRIYISRHVIFDERIFPYNFNLSSNNISSNLQEHDVITSYPTCDEWLTKNDLSWEKDLEAYWINLALNNGMFSQQIIHKNSHNFRCCEEIEG